MPLTGRIDARIHNGLGRPARARPGCFRVSPGRRKGTLPGPLLTDCNILLYNVNIPDRPRHPKKEVEDSLEFAESHAWTVEAPRPGHPWGKATCGREGHDCLVWIWSTPRNAGNHARQIRRAVYRCTEKEGDDE